MFIKDSAGNWYEVDEKVLKDKKVDAQKAQEAIVTERAEKRRKIVDLIAGLDKDDIRILREQLGAVGMMPKNPFDCGDGGDCGDNWDCSDCQTDCDGGVPNCGGDNCPANCDCNCDCANCQTNCDCASSKVGWHNPTNWGGNVPGRYYGRRRSAAMRRFFR